MSADTWWFLRSYCDADRFLIPSSARSILRAAILQYVSARRPRGLVVAIVYDRPHPEQRVRTCLGIPRLYRGFDPGRAEAASARDVAVGALTYKSIALILANGLDRTAPSAESDPVLLHPKLRDPRLSHRRRR